MPILPHPDFLSSRPVLAEGLYGTLRLVHGDFNYWLDGEERVWVEDTRDGSFRAYRGTEVP